jgi:hypothetical protein
MPIEIVYTVYDKKNKRATTSVKVGTTETFARVQLFATAWGAAIDNLIGGVIRSAVALLRGDVNEVVGNTVGALSDVEEIAAFQFDAENGIPIEFSVPAIDEDKVDNETGLLDLTDTDVAAIVTIFEDGLTIGATNIVAVNAGGEGVTELIYAREGSKASGSRSVR